MVRDEYTDRNDLSLRLKKWIRNPETREADYQRHKNYMAQHPEKAKQYAFRARLKRRGTTEGEYNRFLISQNNRCAICKGDDPGTDKDWAIDHCHATNKVRGLLCQSCNLLIGFSYDNTKTLQSAIEYLNKHV